jgi:anti-anti-sigma regulatory factor
MTSLSSASGKVAINEMERRLVVTMPARLSSGILQNVREEVLDRLRTMSARAVILDMTMVGAIDTREFNVLADIFRMVQLMGTPALFSGLQPGAVSALMDLDVDTSGIVAVLNVDEALARFEPAESWNRDAPELDDADPQEPPFDGGL